MLSKDKIIELHRNFNTSTLALSTYIKEVESFLWKHDEQTQFLAAKIKKIRAGEVVEAEPDATIKLELDERQFAIIAAAVDNFATITSQYPDMLLEMGYIYLIALFDAYLTDVFTAVLIFKPEILKSKKQLTYEKIIELSEQGGLISFLAHREMNELSYKSIGEQNDFYKSRFGIDLENSGIPLKVLTELRATRNILVHNRGVVNHIFLELIPDTDYSLGDKIILSIEDWLKTFDHLRQVAKYLKEILLEKFFRD